MPSSLARVAAALLALPVTASQARGADPGDPVQAVRRSGAIVVDGALDEPGWTAAVAFDGFVQRFPDEDAAPAQPTVVRVLYDDTTLYVGVSCHDPRPDLVQRALGRRDNAPWGDSVTIYVDSVREGRNAFVFSVSAAGVQSEGLQSDDDEYVGDWDAVWEGAAAVGAEGWSVEMALPLGALRFQDHGQPVLGLAVRRIVGRSHEEDYSIRVPRNARGLVSRLAPLIGLSGLAPSADLELTPYAAARATWGPQYDDPERPRPRLFQPNADVGLDLKTSLGRGLSLQGTVNPDFGQVEADQIVENLSTFELFFPEKRPFFTQGMDLFRPVAPQGRTSPQQLFYSRRIGIDAPILAAAKVSGSLRDGLQVGLVEAFVSGEGSGNREANPDRSYRLSPSRPLWFGPRSALPQLTPASENFLAAVARWQPDPRVSIGSTVTSALLAGPGCTGPESRRDDDTRPRRCDARGGNAAGLDLSLRTLDGEWFLRGQVSGSQALGGTPERTLPDGTQLHPGDLGLGAHAALGRAGGEPWRFELHWEYEGPRLDLNAAGYQRTQNEQVGRAILRYVRPEGGGPFHSYALSAQLADAFTTDARGLQRGGQVWVGSEFQLRGFDRFGIEGWWDLDFWDVREVDQAGVDEGHRAVPLAARLPGDAGASFWIASNPARPVTVGAGGGYQRSLPRGSLPSVPAYWGWTDLVVRPHPRFETALSASAERNHWPARYVVRRDTARNLENGLLFAELDSPTLSLTLRQLVVLTPRLTLQGYAQLFASYGRYHRFRLATARAGRIRLGGPEDPVADPARDPRTADWWDNPDFRTSAVNVNVVLRWEYRLGSTVYLVYSRSEDELGYPDDGHDPSPAHTLRPFERGPGPTVDTFLVKWTYWWSR